MTKTNQITRAQYLDQLCAAYHAARAAYRAARDARIEAHGFDNPAMVSAAEEAAKKAERAAQDEYARALYC